MQYHLVIENQIECTTFADTREQARDTLLASAESLGYVVNSDWFRQHAGIITQNEYKTLTSKVPSPPANEGNKK